jgi:hypothetical protein
MGKHVIYICHINGASPVLQLYYCTITVGGTIISTETYERQHKNYHKHEVIYGKYAFHYSGTFGNIFFIYLYVLRTKGVGAMYSFVSQSQKSRMEIFIF